MTYWPLLSIRGTAVELSHLEPFEFQCVTRDGELATISVRFNDHCFTRTFDPATDKLNDCLPPEFVAKSEFRVFCPERHRYSYHLRPLIEQIGSKRIATTRNGNLVRLETPDGRNYGIFFTLRRNNSRRADMFIVSAYALDKPGSVAATGEMKFDLALAKILRGEKARFPPKR